MKLFTWAFDVGGKASGCGIKSAALFYRRRLWGTTTTAAKNGLAVPGLLVIAARGFRNSAKFGDRDVNADNGEKRHPRHHRGAIRRLP